MPHTTRTLLPLLLLVSTACGDATGPDGACFAAVNVDGVLFGESDVLAPTEAELSNEPYLTITRNTGCLDEGQPGGELAHGESNFLPVGSELFRDRRIPPVGAPGVLGRSGRGVAGAQPVALTPERRARDRVKNHRRRPGHPSGTPGPRSTECPIRAAGFPRSLARGDHHQAWLFDHGPFERVTDARHERGEGERDGALVDLVPSGSQRMYPSSTASGGMGQLEVALRLDRASFWNAVYVWTEPENIGAMSVFSGDAGILIT